CARSYSYYAMDFW
nr:immunoglobulin heavy chain junction region [Mus musculus]